MKKNTVDVTKTAFQERNNQFVDNIFQRINRIMAKSYDPFVVMLSSGTPVKDIKYGSTTSATVSKTTKNKNTNKSKTKDKVKSTTIRAPTSTTKKL